MKLSQMEKGIPQTLSKCISSSREANFGQDMYRSLERSPQNTRDGFDLYNAQASLAWPRVNLARSLRCIVSRPFWIVSLEFVKVCGILFSIWESFIGFYI